jgi:hypothetical protein
MGTEASLKSCRNDLSFLSCIVFGLLPTSSVWRRPSKHSPCFSRSIITIGFSKTVGFLFAQ